RWAHDFAARRRIDEPSRAMSRLYVAEPRPSPTGSLADHRLAVRPSRIPALVHALLEAVRGRPLDSGDVRERRWINAAAADLVAHKGRGVVVLGDRFAPAVHLLVHVLNSELGAPISYTEPALAEPLGDGMPELLGAIRKGEVHTLVIAGGNPVYDGPR